MAQWSMFFPSPPQPRPAKVQRSPIFARLQRAGAVAVTDDGKPILSDGIMRETLRLAAEINLPVIQHAEDTRETETRLDERGANRIPPWDCAE